MICKKDGHSNQSGGCCCPNHGNTCGFHPEYAGISVIIVRNSSDNIPITTLPQLAASSEAWKRRLEGKNV
jgi:hypothetical protein